MIADRKSQVLARILHNSVYQTDSGLYQRLEKALGKLSLSDLNGLETLIVQKQYDSAKEVVIAANGTKR